MKNLQSLFSIFVFSFFFFLSGFSFFLRALEPGKRITQYDVQNWNMKSGLPVNIIYAIEKTRQGYLWIGTPEGLVRFDGIEFQVYNKSKIPQLHGNVIRALCEDRQGALWIGTNSAGLVCFKEAEFTHYPVTEHPTLAAIRALAMDRWGNLWIGSASGGLTCLNNGSFSTYGKTEGLPGNEVRCFYKDGNEDLWVTTSAGIVKIIAPGQFQVYAPDGILPYYKTSALYDSKEKVLWIGTVGNGLFRMQNGKLTAFGSDAGLPHLTVTYLYKDNRDNLWIGTDGGGLARYSSGNFDTLPGGENQAFAFISAINEDRENNLWVGTLDGGLLQFKDSMFLSFTTREGLNHDYVSCVYEDRSGTIWIGTEAGLNRLYEGKITHFPLPSPGHVSPIVTALFEDQDGYLWIGRWGQLYRFKDGNLTSLNQKEKDGPGDLRVKCITGDSRGNTWIGTKSGLYRFNKQEGSFTTFDERHGLSGSSIEMLFEDSLGKLWIGTDSRTGIHFLKDGQIHLYNPPVHIGNNRVQFAYEDPTGVLWFGSENGLLRIPLTAEEKENAALFTVQNGLSENFIHSIHEDDAGFFWLAGRNGISRVSRKELEGVTSGKIDHVNPVTYNENQGMRSRWCTAPACKTRDGRFWFPTGIGITTIDPGRLEMVTPVPSVLIDKLVVDGEIFTIHQQTLENTPVRLGPGIKRLEIYYRSISFNNPLAIQYRVKLTPYDRRWVEMGNRRNTTYTSLNPGYYSFHVSTNRGGNVWDEKGARLPIYLEPYFYQTRGFIVAVICFLLFGIFSLYRFRVRRLKIRERELGALVEQRTLDLRERTLELEKSKETIENKNKQLEEQSEKLQEMDKVKSRFFANISHEFRTPLTLIQGPLEQILAAQPDKEMEARTRMMLRNSNRLLDLVNQLLELAKLESGKMKLHVTQQDVVIFVKNVVLCFDSLAQQNEVELSFHEAEKEILLYFDPDKIERILFNLLSNAFKYTPAGGKISVTIRQVTSTTYPQGSVEIIVRDSGSGIPDDQLPHVFDRFYRGEGDFESKRKGTGIGLALVRELVELHRGEIEVKSNCRPGPGRGTEFVFRLPMGKEHFQPGEIFDFSIAAAKGEQENEKKFYAAPEVLYDIVPPIEVRGSRKQEEQKIEMGNVESESLRVKEEEAGKKDIILVVDDSADLRAYIRGALEPDFEVLEAADGEEGIEKACEIIPDLVISDIVMPGVDGYELCSRLKKDMNTSHIPVILLTAKASENSMAQGLETGADDYITKPFNTGLLVLRVRNLIRLRRRLQQKIRHDMLLQPGDISISSLDRDFLEKLQGVLEKNFSDPEFTVEELAGKFYLSATTLRRKVEALIDENPNSLLRSYRLNRALQLLQAGYGNVTEVAFAVGFSSTSYFTKCFKDKFNRLPSGYSPE